MEVIFFIVQFKMHDNFRNYNKVFLMDPI